MPCRLRHPACDSLHDQILKSGYAPAPIAEDPAEAAKRDKVEFDPRSRAPGWFPRSGQSTAQVYYQPSTAGTASIWVDEATRTVYAKRLTKY